MEKDPTTERKKKEMLEQLKKEKEPEELTYKERNGTTRVGDFLRSVKDVGPDLLQAAGKLSGIDGLSYVGELLDKDPKIKEQDRQLAKEKIQSDLIEAKLNNKLQIEKEKNRTRRWEADLKSDNKASKNIRPYSLGFLLITNFLLIFLDSAFKGFNVKGEYIGLYENMLLSAVNAYFVLRTSEKPGIIRDAVDKVKNLFKRKRKGKNKKL